MRLNPSTLIAPPLLIAATSAFAANGFIPDHTTAVVTGGTSSPGILTSATGTPIPLGQIDFWADNYNSLSITSSITEGNTTFPVLTPVNRTTTLMSTGDPFDRTDFRGFGNLDADPAAHTRKP